MSQAGIIDAVTTNPSIPTAFVTDSGTAVPIANTLQVLGGSEITTSGATNVITVTFTGSTGAQTVNYTGVATTPYVVLPTDYYLGVNTSVPRTIKMPNAPATGRIFVVKDVTGTSAANPITVETVGGTPIYTINSSEQAISLIWNGAAYELY